MFTGDRSGEWLYRALFRAGFANQPESVGRGDGLELTGAWVTAPVRCAPPANKPTTEERDECFHWLADELDLVAPDVYVCLGSFGYRSLWSYLGEREHDLPRPRPKFAHGLEVAVPRGPNILASYHPSQQNTFTGRLTEEMFDAVFGRAADLVDRQRS